MKRIYLLILFLVSLTTVQAQLYLGLQGGAVLPQGIYAESRMSDNEWLFTEGHQFKAGAGKGFVGGIEVSYAMPFLPAMELAISADYMRSRPSRDVREYYEYIYSLRYSGCTSYQMKLPQIQNIPIMAGVRYAYPVTKGVDFYGLAMAGINLRRITPWSLSYASSDWVAPVGEEEMENNNIDVRTYAPATTFAFRLGAGFIIDKKITLGASFCQLGSAPLEWDRTTTARTIIAGQVAENVVETHTKFRPLKPMLVTVQVGYRFNVLKGARQVQDW